LPPPFVWLSRRTSSMEESSSKNEGIVLKITESSQGNVCPVDIRTCFLFFAKYTIAYDILPAEFTLNENGGLEGSIRKFSSVRLQGAGGHGTQRGDCQMIKHE
jgi:hypothetical protein